MFCLTLLTAAEKVVVASQDKLLETNYMYYGMLETFKVFLPHNSLFLAIVREVAKNVAISVTWLIKLSHLHSKCFFFLGLAAIL